MGYPYGGPFSVQAAEILTSGPTLVGDIHGVNPVPRAISTLAANVQQGNWADRCSRWTVPSPG